MIYCKPSQPFQSGKGNGLIYFHFGPRMQRYGLIEEAKNVNLTIDFFLETVGRYDEIRSSLFFFNRLFSILFSNNLKVCSGSNAY